MAFLCTETFLAGSDGTAIDGGKTLEGKLIGALRHLTLNHGRSATRQVNGCNKAQDGVVDAPVTRAGLEFPHWPRGLKPGRDTLRDEWQSIWNELTIEFADEESGASIYIPDRRVRIGPFFTTRDYGVRDFQKILLHEYLHAALAIEMREAHHGMIEQVLIYNLGYAPPANPVSLD